MINTRSFTCMYLLLRLLNTVFSALDASHTCQNATCMLKNTKQTDCMHHCLKIEGCRSSLVSTIGETETYSKNVFQQHRTVPPNKRVGQRKIEETEGFSSNKRSSFGDQASERMKRKSGALSEKATVRQVRLSA